MIDMDNDLTRELSRAAKGIDLPRGNVATVLRRAVRRRQNRRRQQVTSLTALVALVVTAVVVRLDDDRPRPINVTTTNPRLMKGDTGVVWRRGDTPNALAYVTSQTAGSSYFALSTAPGPADTFNAPPPRVLYRSPDGVEWTTAGAGDSYLADLSARGDRLYAVGTGTVAATTTRGRSVSDVAVSSSDDGARTWKRTVLDIDLDAVAAKSEMVQVGSLSIAAGERGVVAVVGMTAQLDLATLLPTGFTAPNGWALSDRGVDLLGAGTGTGCPAGSSPRETAPPPPTTIRPGAAGPGGRVYPMPCKRSGDAEALVSPQEARGVVASLTWAELGVDGDLLRAVQGTPAVYWSADGNSFERVDAPLAGVFSVQATTAGEGFVIVGQTSGEARAVAMRSVDGRTWTPTGGLGSLYVRSVGAIGGRAAVLGSGREGPMVLTLDGNEWRRGSLADVDAAVAGSGARATLAGAAVGPLGLVAVAAAGDQDNQARPSYRVLYSRDGTTWSSHALDELAGGPVAQVGAVLVTDSKVVVTAIPPSPGNRPADHATVVVGTI